MASSLQLRVLSGGACSTSGSSHHEQQHRAGSCLVVRAEASDSRQPLNPAREGWLGNSCWLQRRPSYPRPSWNRSAPEVASLDTAFTASQNGKPFEIYQNTEFVAETLLPTVQGKFRVRAYRHSVDGCRTYTEPSCVMTGEPEGCEEVPIRVHDACFTSEVLGSLKCDCAGQLQLALEYMQKHAPGIVIYLQQEGRGIGLANKIAAYALQEKGLDTVDANRALGLPDDCREYTSVRNILKDLGIKSVKLMTNNPRKIKVLEQLGVKVTGRLPCIVQPGALNSHYLATKRQRMAHLLDEVPPPEPLEGQFCYWDHDGEPLAPLVGDLASQNGKPTSGNSTSGSASGSSSSSSSSSNGPSSDHESMPPGVS